MSDRCPFLSEDLLDRCAERAPIYDRENRFFQEDFDELREAGYLTLPVPEDLGGPGWADSESSPPRVSSECRAARVRAVCTPRTPT